MVRWRSLVPSYSVLIRLVGWIPCQVAAAAVAPVASSVFVENNFTVPDYVAKHAPLIWLHSQDPFKPSDILAHVQHTTPYLKTGPIPDQKELNLDNLATLNDVGGRVYLTANDDPLQLPSWLLGENPDESGRLHNSTACVVVLVEKSEAEIDAFYFYFYSYDRGANITQVLEPLNRMVKDDGGVHFGDHVGDWEHNMVRFVNGKPTGVYYSQHSDGEAFDWDDKGLTKQDERPIVYSAYGSHANWASPGDHIHDLALIDYCDAGYRWDPVQSAYFYYFDPATFTVTPLQYPGAPTAPASPQSFFYFRGAWGDRQYPDTDPRQLTVPRFGLKRFVTGPTGPRAKQLVRKGLFPDRRHKKSWLEIWVGIFMTLYPCCIRGWRKWVWLVLLLAFSGTTVMGIVYAVRRYKRRGYEKVEREIPMEDWEREGRASRDS